MRASDESLDEIEMLLRDGNHKRAKKIIKSIPLKSVPARLAVRLSGLMVRAGELRWSAKLLFPLMYEGPESPSAQIMAQYALTLQQLGAYNEAANLYEQLDFKAAPEANLYYALALFSKWEYEKAVPHLESYLSSSAINDYQRKVGRANLAQAFIAINETQRAGNLLSELETDAKNGELYALLSYVMDLRSQLLISQKKYKEAIAILNKSEKLISGGESRYELMVRFWRTVCEYALSPQKENSLKAIIELRLNCVKQGRWALVRECDFYRSVISEDTNLFLKVYFGTPFPAYRKRLEERFGTPVGIPEYYLWNPVEKNAGEKKVLKVFEGIDLQSGNSLKRGQVLHRLLRALCSDFYVPFSSESLFFYLFPGEKFNPQTSSKRSRFATLRLQRWFKESKIPLQIRYKDEAFRIFFTAPYLVEVKLDYSENFDFAAESALLNFLRIHPLKTAGEISVALKIPLRTVQRKLSALLGNKRIESQRRGRDIYYRLK